MQFIFDHLIATIVAATLGMTLISQNLNNRQASQERQSVYHAKAQALGFGEWLEDDIVKLGARFGRDRNRFLAETETINGVNYTRSFEFYYHDEVVSQNVVGRVEVRYELEEDDGLRLVLTKGATAAQDELVQTYRLTRYERKGKYKTDNKKWVGGEPHLDREHGLRGAPRAPLLLPRAPRQRRQPGPGRALRGGRLRPDRLLGHPHALPALPRPLDPQGRPPLGDDHRGPALLGSDRAPPGFLRRSTRRLTPAYHSPTPMGKAALLFVLAASLGGATLMLSTQETDVHASAQQGKYQADVIAREIARTAFNTASADIHRHGTDIDKAIASFGEPATECANGKAVCSRRTGEMLGGTYVAEASYDGGNGVDVYAAGTFAFDQHGEEVSKTHRINESQTVSVLRVSRGGFLRIQFVDSQAGYCSAIFLQRTLSGVEPENQPLPEMVYAPGKGRNGERNVGAEVYLAPGTQMNFAIGVDNQCGEQQGPGHAAVEPGVRLAEDGQRRRARQDGGPPRQEAPQLRPLLRGQAAGRRDGRVRLQQGRLGLDPLGPRRLDGLVRRPP